MKDLIDKIKAKKPLNKLDDSFIEGFVNNFFKSNFKLKKKFSEGVLKEKDKEVVVKSVRNEINQVYGQFWINDKLELDSHKSSKERIDSYERIYNNIFKITGKPNTILDLGCGLNPLTYDCIGKDVYFIVVELTDEDCNRIKKYFIENDIKGEVIKADLRTYTGFPEADVCFMFKVLESLESKGHLLAEHLIKSIKARYIVASFSTQTVRNKRMNYPRRGWIEIMLQRLGLVYTKYEESNEIFYIIKK